jgi:hypothetical protein
MYNGAWTRVSALFLEISSPSFTDSEMTSKLSLIPLLSLAIKNEHVVNAERYISGELMPSLLYSLLNSLTFPAAVALAMFVYDYMLTLGDEIKYIWRRPVTGVKILYLILRYGVAFAEVVYFQGESFLRVCTKLNVHMTYSTKWDGNAFDT